MIQSTGKTNLLGLTQPKMEAFFEQLGEKRFRAGQIMKWIHHYGVDDFDAMTNVGKALREKLKSCAEIRGPEVVSEDISRDGTRKWVVRVASGSCVETVYIPQNGRGTLCVSSQAGCALDCSFCSTGKQGFNSDLTAAEIIGQVWVANKSFGTIPAKMDRAITNVVMMGMGEPLLNFDNVVDAMNLMMDDLGYGISKRKVTLSTSGVVPMIHQLAQVTDVALALSLHAPNDELRNQLVPLNRKYPLKELLAACNAYIGGLGEKRVLTVEYTLLKDVNDQPEHALQMIELLRNTPCKINLIPFNPFPHSGYERPSANAIRRFQDLLHHAGYNVTVRTTRGEDIDAACGQLVGQVADRTRRSERYIAVRQLAEDESQALVQPAVSRQGRQGDSL
jgi:23S rRNA (adenine2503-C2)-methyltransferase